MTAAPQTAAAWEEYLSKLDTPEKFNKAFGSGEFKTALNGYVNAQNKERADLLEQVKVQTESTMTEWLKANQEEVGAVNRLDLNPLAKHPAGTFNKTRNPNAAGAGLDGVFDSFAGYLNTLWNHTHPAGNPTTAQREAIGKLLNYQEKVPSEGGFLVPEEFRSQLLSLSLGSSIVRPRAVTIPMSSATLTLPMIDETSRVSSVFGGVIVYRTEEGAELTESAAAFGAIKLIASKQTALAHVTNELVRDVPAFAAYIEQTFPPAMAFEEDYDFLTGNGAGEPLGMLHANNTAIIEVAKETGQTAATIVWQNVLKMYARFYGNYERAIWIASPDTFVELATMALTVGTGGSAVWLTDGTQRPRLTLLGAPVFMTEKAPAVLGTRGDLSLVDPGFYLIGDRQMITVDSSPHVKFTSDKTTFRAIARNDGQPWVKSALTPRNNSATLSPFVQLATRA